MTDIKKTVDGNIPKAERGIVFTQADAGAGDVILINDSIGFYATKLKIETEGSIVVRFNVYNDVAPLRSTGDGVSDYRLANITRSNQYKNTTQPAITITPTTPFLMVNYFPVKDVEIVSATGNFTITVQHVSDIASSVSGGGSFDTSVNTTMDNDVQFGWGTASNYWGEYNSTGTQFELWSFNVGAATPGIVFSVDDGTDDVDFSGDITVPTSAKIYLDGGTDDYFTSPSTGQVSVVTAGQTRVYFNTSGIVLNDSRSIQFGSGADQLLTYTDGTGVTWNDGTNNVITIPDDSNQVVMAGGSLLSSTGSLTIGGTGGTNNENLTLDFESVSNQVTFGTTTGGTVASFNFSVVNSIGSFRTGSTGVFSWFGKGGFSQPTGGVFTLFNTGSTSGASLDVNTANTLIVKDQAGTGSGNLKAEGTVGTTAVTVAAAPAGSYVGEIKAFTNGDAGSPCLAMWDGANWLRISLGAAVSAT